MSNTIPIKENETCEVCGGFLNGFDNMSCSCDAFKYDPRDDDDVDFDDE